MNGTGELRERPRVIEDDGLGLLQRRKPRTQVERIDGALRRLLREHLRGELTPDVLDPFAGAERRNRAVTAKLRAIIQAAQGSELGKLPTDDDSLLALFAAAAGWGPAQRYLDDPRINEVKIINQTILVQEAGKPWTVAPETFASVADVQQLATNQADLLGVRLDAATPQATVPVAHGTRMHVSIPPCVDDGVLVCIRRGRTRAWNLHDVQAHGSFDVEVGRLLQLLIDAQCSFLIAGRTNSGKTGLLEAAANSWPGQPHVISIEDHTLEIGIRNAALWTRELVASPEAFASVAREALRQTPGLLLPGEARGHEAGAILAMAMTGHAVITTVHAPSCAAAVRRFASYARQPGAYLYADRYADALRDTCEAFPVVVTLDFWEQLGLRVVTEIALIAGVSDGGNGGEPELVPLAELHVSDEGELGWTCYAVATDAGLLRWHNGAHDRTPEALATRLRYARARAQARAAQSAPSRDVLAERIATAEHHLRAGQATRALAVASAAWRERPDERLYGIADGVLAMAPAQFGEQQGEAQRTRQLLGQAIADGDWERARTIANEAQRELLSAAVVRPASGWAALLRDIDEALARHAAARAACRAAELALDGGAARVAQQHLTPIEVRQLPRDLARSVLTLRRRALRELLERGEAAEASVRVTEAELAALQAMPPDAPHTTKDSTP